MLDDFDLDVPEEGAAEGASDNRTFVMVAGGIGGFLLIAMLCLAVYAFFILPGQTGDDEAALTATAQQAEIDQRLTGTAIVDAYTPTITDTPLPTNTATMTSTATQPVAEDATATEPAIPIFTEVPLGGPTIDPRTVTVQALYTAAAVAQTQAASSILTVTPTSTLTSILPETGFIDDIGAPGLMAFAALLILVIFAARRLREANA